MTSYTNPAKRLLSVLGEASQKNPNEATGKVWSSVFGLPWDDNRADPHYVQRKLAVLREEIDLLELQMKRTAFAPEGYAQYLDRVRTTISKANLDATWKSYFQSLYSPEVQLSLLWCSQVIADEESVSMDDLADLLATIKAFRANIDSLKISEPVRDFILRQLDLIEQAIQEYPIRGGAAIRDGFHKAAAVYAGMEDAPLSNTEAENVGKVNGLFSRLGKAADGVIKADKLVTAVLNIAEKSAPATKAIAAVIDKLPGIGQ